jgi:hypothetical protein
VLTIRLLKLVDEISAETKKSASQLENALGLQVNCSSLAAQQTSMVAELYRPGELPE